MTALATVLGRGTHAGRPAAGNTGRYYYETDTTTLFRDNGSSWDNNEGAGGLADQGTATYLDFTVGSAPATPASGKLRLYALTGKHMYQKDDGGTATALDAAGGGSAESWSDVRTALNATLVHWWDFAEASGDFVDSIGSLHLVPSGTVTYQQTGPLGATSAASFASGAKAAASTMGSAPTGGNARTVIYIGKQPTAGGSATSQELVGWGTSGSTRQYWIHKVNDNGTYQDSIIVWADDMVNPGPNTAVSDGGWHMVAFGYDGQSTITQFVDGTTYVRRLGAALNTGTTTKPTVCVAASLAFNFDELMIFSSWLGRGALHRFWKALQSSL